jgi:hypothetical protein
MHTDLWQMLADRRQQARVLDYHSVDPRRPCPIHEFEGFGHLVREYQYVRREIDTDPPKMRETSGFCQLGKGEVARRATRVESVGAHVDRIGAVGDGGSQRESVACRSEKLGPLIVSGACSWGHLRIFSVR